LPPERQLGFLWGGVALVLLVAAPLLATPAGAALGAALPPCAFKALTGFPCAGCGTTRAVLALARHDVPGAFVMNPLAAASALFGLLGGLVAGLLALLGRGVRQPARWPGWARLLAAGAFAANWAFVVAAGR
jgi:hypothetical protein